MAVSSCTLSIMPLSATLPKAEPGVMNSTQARARAGHVGHPQRTLITGNPTGTASGDPLLLRPSRLADRLSARLLGASLDRRLAAGHLPESSPLLAVRAQRIVAIGCRRELARDWERLLRTARRVHGTYHPTRPIRSAQVIAAEPAVRELVRRVAAPLPVAARGVAMATVLLTDAGSPVYNPHSRVCLSTALAAATEQLDPALPLLEP